MAETETTKHEQSVRLLRQAILSGELVPGTKLRQQAIANWLGVSSTPVREAMCILLAEGLLVHVSNKGFFVAEHAAVKQ
jgi:GntR family transcriptional regulator of vanillate catabolism